MPMIPLNTVTIKLLDAMRTMPQFELDANMEGVSVYDYQVWDMAKRLLEANGLKIGGKGFIVTIEKEKAEALV